MRTRLITLALVFASFPIAAEMLPGFSLEEIAPTRGFLTSIAFDPGGALHYTTTDGGIWMLSGDGQSVEVARVESANEGNAALLGMAFDREGSIIVHYVSSDLTADVVSRIDPKTRAETTLARFQCSPGGQPCPTEHHGGNPAIAPDGTIFVGIGDYGLLNIAQRDDVFAAKIFRIAPAGDVEVWAKGFRNPFDLAWDEKHGRLVGDDNGAVGDDDEVVFVEPGENHGWPLTMGNMPAVSGMTPPVYVFPERTAPTGLTIADAETGWFRRGVLVTSFVTRALYFFPRIGETGLDPPVTIVRSETMPLIDVRQSPDGEIYAGSGFSIYRLVGPLPGDVDGDGEVTRRDWQTLVDELADGAGERVESAHEGSVRSTWGADVNQDGVVDSRDLAELSRRLGGRKRPAGHRGSPDRRRPIGRKGGR